MTAVRVQTGDPLDAVTRLGDARRVLLTTHASPDGDALGSELALAELCDGLGLDTVIANRDPGPGYLERLPGVERVGVGSELPGDFPTSFDLVVTLECPELERPGLDGLDQVPIVNIDHHKANTLYGELNYLDEDSPAVGEMVLRMFRAAEIQPTPAAATNMYVALSTDTGDFRYPNTTPRAFYAAAALTEAGANPAVVAQWVHEQRRASSVRLLGEALQTLRLDCGGRLAIMSVDQQAFTRAGASPEDTEDLIAAPRSIAGVEIVAFFKQSQPGKLRVSLRSKGAFDVQQVAADFGGGGHTNAAGCSLSGDTDAARSSLIARLAELLEAGS